MGVLIREPEDYTNKVYDIVRAKVIHEDTWIQHRVSWLLASNGFLFLAYGALLTIKKEEASQQILSLRDIILQTVPVIGMLVCIAVLVGIVASNLAMKQAGSEWKRLIESDEERRSLPDLRSTGYALWMGRLASSGISVFLLLAWVIILVISIKHL